MKEDSRLLPFVSRLRVRPRTHIQPTNIVKKAEILKKFLNFAKTTHKSIKKL